MTQPPAAPKIYHIAHVDKLASISKNDFLSDAAIREQNLAGTVIGMDSIKGRRLGLPVSCHPGTTVGQYVRSTFVLGR